MRAILQLAVLSSIVIVAQAKNISQPHIIFILADDLVNTVR